MIRKVAITGLVAIASLIGPAATKTASADPPAEGKAFVIKLGTLAPRSSTWGNLFEAWKRTVKKETKGACELDWAYSGSAGDETGMIGAMKSKGLHGGALTETGLSSIYPSVIALQMPGLVENWAGLDAMRNKARPTFDKAFDDAGYKILGWGDVGIGHVMFRKGEGKPEIRTPDNLKQYHPFYIAGDQIGSMFLATLGIQSPKALSVPAILPAIAGRNSDSVDVITTPAIAAEQLQWAPHVTHVVDMPVGFGIGALVMDKEFHKSIPEACKQVINDTGKNTSELLTTAIRGKDAEAWAELMKTKTVVKLTPEETAAWKAKFLEVRNKLKAEGKINAATWQAVTDAAAGK
jgi:TRAP-type C4-dicarboxylate transport system substrate-binding protein